MGGGIGFIIGMWCANAWLIPTIWFGIAMYPRWLSGPKTFMPKSALTLIAYA